MAMLRNIDQLYNYTVEKMASAENAENYNAFVISLYAATGNGKMEKKCANCSAIFVLCMNKYGAEFSQLLCI